MKIHMFTISGLIFTSLLFSCKKNELPIPDNLVMDIESCKPKNKKNLYVGMEYQGGIIFKLDETGKHGFIVAKEDLGPAPWGCYGTSIPAAQVGDGLANTLAILANCPEPGIAARLCDAYIVREKGDHGKKYDDWFMPSFGQFYAIGNILKDQAKLICNRSYLTSDESYGSFKAIPLDPNTQAWKLNIICMENGSWSHAVPNPFASKKVSYYVRPIRAF